MLFAQSNVTVFLCIFAADFDSALEVQHLKWYIMKKLVALLFVLFAVASVYAAEPDSLLLAGDSFRNPINREDCTFKGIPQYGNVKVVEYAADFNVKIVEYAADLDVKIVDCCADRCGEWKFVEYAPDFTIRFVNSAPEFEIRLVEHAPGVR